MDSFSPFPLLSNPHVQTVLGNLLSGAALSYRSVPSAIPLPDGDHVVVHDCRPPVWQQGGAIAVLVHGLGGCHDSGYMRRVTQGLAKQGMRVFRMDLRGTGAGVAFARRFYSAACSEDVRAVVEHLTRRHPGSPVLVAGFSLGGGIVLKLAGEAGERPLRGLCAVAAVAPPLDLVRCWELMARQPLYDAFFVRRLIQQVRSHQRHFPNLPRVRFPRRLTLRGFDDIYTAPRWGFADAMDYYRRASALPWVGKARVPTFLLTARDDPFIAVEPFEAVLAAPHIEVHISAHGGHLGFLGLDGEGGIRWAERQLVNWLLSQASRVVGTEAAGDNTLTSLAKHRRDLSA
jgi:predicted alpha/beta-fold hydrolase